MWDSDSDSKSWSTLPLAGANERTTPLDTTLHVSFILTTIIDQILRCKNWLHNGGINNAYKCNFRNTTRYITK